MRSANRPRASGRVAEREVVLLASSVFTSRRCERSPELVRALALSPSLDPLSLETVSAVDRRSLGAIAVEQVLDREVLAKLRPDAVAWSAEGVRAGFLVVVAPGELAVHPAHEQPVLRALATSGELVTIARQMRALLGSRSVSDVTVALQAGDREAYAAWVTARRPPRRTPYRAPAECLRQSVCEPFDATWFERTWGDAAPSVAEQVLHSCLDELTPCGALVDWLRANAITESAGRVEALLHQHALLTGRTTLVSPSATGYLAAARFVDGDRPAADELIARAFGTALDGGRGRRSSFPAYGAVAPILALLLCARDTEPAHREGTSAAKQLLAIGQSETERGVARAFRTLLRYRSEPTATPNRSSKRLDVHQLGATASPWELLLTAFTVHLHHASDEQPWTRASWAQHLTHRALDWTLAGYAWLGAQGLLLARALDAEYYAREVRARGGDPTLTPPVLSLWELLAPKPTWQKTLEALEQVSRAHGDEQSADTTRRAAWFLDVTDGTLNRPALQEWRASSGWSQGKRVSVAELFELRDELPLEDRRVLDCTRETRSPLRGSSRERARELTSDALEALIGHPRVFDGARAATPVEVARGTCRVETQEDGDHIRVVVEPKGAVFGVNVVVESEIRVVVYRVTSVMRRVIEALPVGTRIPKRHESEVVRVLSSLSRAVEVRSPQLAAEREVEADATPCVRITSKAGAWMVQLGVRPFGAQGRFFVAGMGRPSILLEGEQRLRCTRDLALERARVDALVSACRSLAPDPEDPPENPGELDLVREADTWIFGESSMLSLLADLRDSRAGPGEIVCALEWSDTTPVRLAGRVTRDSFHVGLRSRKGWYLATGGARLDEVTEIALADLVRAPSLVQGRFIRLPNGDFLEVEKRVRRVLEILRASSSPKRKQVEVEVHRGAIEALRRLTDADSGVEAEPEARAWLERVDRVTQTAAIVPDTLRAELRPYQVEGFRFLHRLAALGLGACLADDMGLGKTVQILALLLTRMDEGPTLVVAPTSVCGNWVREIRRFAPTLTPVEYTGKDRGLALTNALAPDARGQVVVCSYALLQQDEAELRAPTWGTAILDEAQFIKNAESLRAQAAFRLSAKQRIAATGTPVENHFGDLWSIFQFLEPGLLGDWRRFKRRFVTPLESGATGFGEPEGHGAPELVLRDLVRPYILRRSKREVLRELPPLTVVQHEVHLSQEDTLRYGLLRKRIHEKLFTSHGRRHSKLEVLAEITRLRRFCCHPRLVFPDAGGESAKIQTFLDLVEELRQNGHRALVFSQWVDFLELVREQLDERGIRYEYLDGSTPSARRQARVDAFQSGRADLFLISLKAGGFGLNLTAADYVIHLDPWWNPAVEAQASDRAHRIGQDRPVTVYRLVTKHTIEERMLEIHAKKQRLSRSLLDPEHGGELDGDELVELIGVEDGSAALEVGWG